MNNTITNSDYPTVVKIHPDGRFEADMLLNYPHWQTTVMIVDWEDFK